MQQNYKPGSTFKPIVALTAVKEGVASLSGGSYDCPAELHGAGRQIRDASYDNWSTTDLGYMSIAHALQVSCDTVFDKFGDDFWNRWRDERLRHEQRAVPARPPPVGLRESHRRRPAGRGRPA